MTKSFHEYSTEDRNVNEQLFSPGRLAKDDEKRRMDLYTPQEAADMLRLTMNHVHRLVRQGKIACVQVSRKVRLFTWHQLEEFTRSRTAPLPKPVDKNQSKRVPSLPIQSKGGVTFGELRRAQRRKEMRSWR